MAVDVIIQRLEEAVETCSTVEDEIRQAQEPLDDLLGRVTQLTETITAEGQETERALEEASRVAAELRSNIEDAGEQARTQLESVSTRAKALEEEADAGLHEIETSLEELDGQREQLASALQSGLELTSSEVQEILGQIENLQVEIALGLDNENEAIEAFQAQVGDAVQSCTTAQGQWTEALAALSESTMSQVVAVQQANEALIQGLGQAMLQAGNSMVEEHNSAMDFFWEGLGEDGPEMVEASLEALSEALEQLEDARSRRAGEVDETFPPLSEFVRLVGEILDNLQSEVNSSAARVPRL